ncbi:MAG: flagellar hook-associated protein FlgK [Rhizobiales bacterium PAR1]|nr:MAG: flagellar hook-associated protein FlgK [Rhizobiales bacterium PAR1]
MGLFTSLQNALSGLSVNQAQMSLVSRNVANAGTVGYSRRVLTTQETTALGINAGAVKQVSIDRMLDTLLQKQLRTESGGAAYSSTRSDYLQRLDSLFGQPGSNTAVTAVFTKFSTSIQQLAADPASSTARQDALANAQSLTATLNSLGNNVQTMRAEIESKIADQAQQVNTILDGIESTTQKLNEITDSDTRAGLLDQRDKYIDQLSTFFDVRVSDNGTGNYNVYTANGGPLYVQGRHLRFQFDERTITPQSLYNANIAQSGVGHLVISDPVGGKIDFNASRLMSSGSMSALFDLRDNVLTQTQAQLDDFAAALTTSIGDKTISSTAATVGAQTGFDLDLSALQSGNVVTLNYTQQPGGTKQKVSFIAVNSASALPLSSGVTADPNDIEFGIDFSGGMAAAIASITANLATVPGGAGFTVNNLGAGVVQILDDGAGNTLDVNSLSARATVTALTGQGTAMPFFVDGNAGSQIYSGSWDSGSQKVGYANGIRINPALLADPSRLVVYQTVPTTTNSGDPTRPSFLRDQIQSWQSDFTPAVALTGSTAIYQGTSGQFLDRLVATQTQAAGNAKSLSEGQQVVLSTLQARAADVSGVKTDQELSDLVAIQNTYSANARIVSAVRDMFDALMRI